MGIMSGLLIPNEKFDISVEVDTSKWKYLLIVDQFYLNFLKDARFIRSNDLLYAYATEYNLQDVVSQMHPNSSTFSAFKLRMAPYMQKFYTECVIKRLNEMFGFYKGALLTIKDNPNKSFFGNKTVEDCLVALSKTTELDDIFNKVDDVYLTLKNYLKLQINQTTELLSDEVVENFIKKLETILMTKNEGINDDQLRRKYCRVVEIANLFLCYTKSFVDADAAHNRMCLNWNNSALVSFDQLWKHIIDRYSQTKGIAGVIRKGLPYCHIDIDAAVCIFPETTDYPLLKTEFTKQNRPFNPNSEHLINDWMMHWFLTNKLQIQEREEHFRKAEDNLEL